MFEPYLPKRFCREYVEIRGDSGQLVNFMAVVLGHKPLMDDWVHASVLQRFLEMCRGYGLSTATDCTFVSCEKSKVPAAVLGRDSITSTSAFALPLEANQPGQVHIYLSRDPHLLRHGMWYSMIVRDRVLWPPRQDMLRYGRFLGYPPCCIAFFQKYNNWSRYSFLYEIYRRASTFHAWCNPLVKDRIYSYIYHMPCSFSCAETRRSVQALRRDLLREEPDLVATIDRHLLLPALVFRERKIYFFEGTLQRDRIHYSAHHWEGGEAGADVCSGDLHMGDTVEVSGAHVRILKGDQLVRELTCHSDGFAPELPFVIGFQRTEESTL